MNTDIQKRIHEQVTTHPVVLYMKGTPQFPQCGFSAKAVGILNAGREELFTVDVLQDAESAGNQGLCQLANHRSFTSALNSSAVRTS